MYFSIDQTAQLNKRVGKLEKNTHVELVTAVVGRCDNYPEIPWKAFAMGTAICALLVLIQDYVLPGWTGSYRVLFNIVFVLGTGAFIALLTVFWPGFARLFLDKTRAKTEAEQFARSFFLEREIFKTRERTGILMLIGLFEHQVIILPDSGVADRVDPQDLKQVITQMTVSLKKGDFFKALNQGINALEDRLSEKGFKGVPGAVNQIPDEPIEQKGADK